MGKPTARPHSRAYGLIGIALLPLILGAGACGSDDASDSVGSTAPSTLPLPPRADEHHIVVAAQQSKSSFPFTSTESVVEQVELIVDARKLHDVDGLLEAVAVPHEQSYPGFQEALSEEITQRAADLEGSAEARQRVFIAVTLVSLGAAAALTRAASRSITGPLRVLTPQATAMADHRLPEAVNGIVHTPLGEDVQMPQVDPVVVRTRDEVADVAAALNIVQDTAVRLAVEQAVLRRNIADSFVNLGRRNQT